jgi:hypothetical protein
VRVAVAVRVLVRVAVAVIVRVLVRVDVNVRELVNVWVGVLVGICGITANTGMVRIVDVPSPSCPLVLIPQQATALVVVIAHV